MQNQILEIQEYKYAQVSVTYQLHAEVNQQCHNDKVILTGIEFTSQSRQDDQSNSDFLIQLFMSLGLVLTDDTCFPVFFYYVYVNNRYQYFLFINRKFADIAIYDFVYTLTLKAMITKRALLRDLTDVYCTLPRFYYALISDSIFHIPDFALHTFQHLQSATWIKSLVQLRIFALLLYFPHIWNKSNASTAYKSLHHEENYISLFLKIKSL